MTVPPLPLNGITPLPALGVIRAQGADAGRFLHGQLTQDFALLPPHQARLAAYLTPKGRMLASFIAWQRGPEDYLLVCSRDLLAATLKRLAMFVLRAKVQLHDASADFQLWGLAGDALISIAGSAQPTWAKADFDAANLVHLYPACGQPRGLWLAPADAPAPSGAALAPALWAWGEVQSGVATLCAALTDAFVPQMLNYESIDGVNFKKGCYPGQEVVARSQFRGQLKRRAYLAHADAELPVGAEIFTPEDAEQPVGQVAQAAPAPGGGWDALVVLQTSAAQAALHAGAAQLTLGSLPYPLRDDI